MVDPLQFLWPAVEVVRPVFARAAVVRWPKGVHKQLVSAKLLVPVGTTTRIRCPQCGQTHEARISARVQPDGTFRYFIPCPEHLRAEVTDRDLQQWAASVEGIAKTVAKSLSLTGQCKDLASGRVWRCGRANYQGVLRDVLFARGLRRKDAGQFRREITRAHCPIVFVGSETPDADFWSKSVPTLIRLCEVAQLVNNDLQIDLQQVIGLIRTADEAGRSQSEIVLTQYQLGARIRRQIKAEKRTELTDDLVIAARLKHGSSRRAAEALTADGFPIHHSTVSRIVKKSEKIVRGESSESIARSVASHRRNRRKQIQNRPEASDFE